MLQDPRIIIARVLTIIGYTGHKKAFSERFVGLILDQAFLTIMVRLSNKKKLALREKLSGENDKERISIIIKKYVDQTIYNHAVEEATTKLFTDYVNTILPTLRLEEEKKLFAYLSTFDHFVSTR